MGDFNHGHIQWNSLESTGDGDQHLLYIVLSSQKELLDNVNIKETLGNSDHNQIHFDINIKSESKNKNRIGETVIIKV